MYIGLIAGGHAAGKRTVCLDMKRELERESSVPLTVKLIDVDTYNSGAYGPHINFDRLLSDIDKLKAPDGSNDIQVVLVHGNYALYDQRLLDRARLRVFVDTDADTRLSQWILRDVATANSDGHIVPMDQSDEGKRALEDILNEYLSHCRPEYLQYIDETKKNADVLLPRGSDALGIRLLATSVIDDVRQNLFQARESKAHTPTAINLRAEAVAGLDQQFYSTN